MATITLKGNPINTLGIKPKTGSVAPDFTLLNSDLQEVSLSSLKGKYVVLNIFPSLDTAVCATSVRQFNKLAAGKPNTVVLAISKDLPFAHKRFCTTEGIENVQGLSTFRHPGFEEQYGLTITESPLAQLLARAVVVVNPEGVVVYEELVPEIVQEPDYEKALAAIK
ncbi:MAG: thiol peroxidase [Bacteroidales bacterium]